MTTNGYHPLARCPEAARLYFAWIDVAKKFKRGSKEYEVAFEEYMTHIKGGCNCREGLDEVR